MKRLEILKVRWKGWKIRYTQGEVEEKKDRKYSRLVRMEED